MKVIKAPIEQHFVHTCEYCQGVFEFEWQDVIIDSELTTIGGYIRTYTLDCPCCGQTQMIEPPKNK